MDAKVWIWAIIMSECSGGMLPREIVKICYYLGLNLEPKIWCYIVTAIAHASTKLNTAAEQ